MVASSQNKGISLLSSLAAVTILGLLAALLIPAIADMVEKSKSAACLGNLRQIGVALQLYMAEYNGSYPPNRMNPRYRTEEKPSGVHHQDSLKVYLTPYPNSGTITSKMAGVFWCPSDKARKHQLAQHSYGANTYIGGLEPEPQQNIRAEQKPSEKLYLIEATRSNLSTSLFSHNTWPFNGGPMDKPNTEVYVDFRHHHRANGLYLDGHVATFSVEDLHGQDPRKLIPRP